MATPVLPTNPVPEGADTPSAIELPTERPEPTTTSRRVLPWPDLSRVLELTRTTAASPQTTTELSVPPIADVTSFISPPARTRAVTRAPTPSSTGLSEEAEESPDRPAGAAVASPTIINVDLPTSGREQANVSAGVDTVFLVRTSVLPNNAPTVTVNTNTAGSEGINSSAGPSAGAIAGAVVGGILGLILGSLVVIQLLRRRGKRKVKVGSVIVPFGNGPPPTFHEKERLDMLEPPTYDAPPAYQHITTASNSQGVT
ncbi:hypothetical protein FA15DRAFT_76137 [Coprinopsis marcescibilis]|uniref:Mid2 domain-containing protein n=1 Tax=Coprinopsis marcescibilis TaxID=230819 RepID=A0A5C3L682_COPMA|nr:hypothetical protein FA15DRAFT_76137 [Coprinopsis marcescibilis]